MRFVIKSLIAVASTVTASAGTVAAVNHTEFGQKHTPDCVKNVCRKTEDVVLNTAKDNFRKLRQARLNHEKEAKAVKQAVKDVRSKTAKVIDGTFAKVA